MPGNKNKYLIEYLPQVINKDLLGLNKEIKDLIKRKVERLIEEPLLGFPLKGKLSGYFKLKISKYRIVYKIINDQLIILIIAIGKRDNFFVYSLAEKRI
ncbi:MAG: type II toxin-antitoxin system RelE/ParE family toxin [Candidatus Melainabacteria bacterium]|nr:type II toxin-antitoxin system RelE/ParE family toxin [Candidatus Melainabacteria bacterium]